MKQNDGQRGIHALLRGHTDKVNAIKFFPQRQGKAQVILSGSVDKTIRVWQAQPTSTVGFEEVLVLEGHDSTINCLGVVSGKDVFASGSADATVKIWKFSLDGGIVRTELIQTIKPTPRFFPLALILSELPLTGDVVLAVAGTKNFVQIFTAEEEGRFNHQATLMGHEAWVRSLAITQESNEPSSDLLFASASQDKYIRLWRIHKEEQSRTTLGDGKNGMTGSFEKLLSNKSHKLVTSKASYSVTFEALVLGHEDWIYTVYWSGIGKGLRLLSASADNSLAIWEPDVGSGIWVCTTRLGEISAQKGSTTATGSTGGFWVGLWSPNGDSVISLGRTGSWRLWNYDEYQTRWVQGIGVGGHVKSVMDVAWAKDGTYLLSTGSDQTTRLHAEWKRHTGRSWHEFARPQIHGYDMNCIDSMGRSRFISGADEKLLRVFDEPRAVANLLHKLCGMEMPAHHELPDAANVPVLGLSNKAVENLVDGNLNPNGDLEEGEVPDVASITLAKTFDLDQPPLEDHLARNTLWPEREKLYGHGYEISAVTSSHDGTIVATACRASSIDHAVIRLYETKKWRELKPTLTAHSLTVTCLRFSKDDRLLLSVGRDRQWAVFEKDVDESERYSLKDSNPKGHSRMILSAGWAPLEAGRVFATAGRDKVVKIWKMQAKGTECARTLTEISPVTAIDVLPRIIRNTLTVAIGTEQGQLTVYTFSSPNMEVQQAYVLGDR